MDLLAPFQLPDRQCDSVNDRFRSRVQVSRPAYLDWLAYFEDAARRSHAERLAAELYHFPYEPYAPVRKQVLNIVRVLNRVRKQRGRRPLDAKRVARYRRRIVQVFGYTDRALQKC